MENPSAGRQEAMPVDPAAEDSGVLPVLVAFIV